MGVPLRRDKYRKYKILKNSGLLSQHVPQTGKLSKSSFYSYLGKYGDIILKPLEGGRGFGVIRVSAPSKDRSAYELHHENEKKSIKGKDKLYSKVQKIAGSRSYMVQRRIPLATINGRMFDLRVIVQRLSKSKPWKVTGKAVKVAGEGYIVTNIERSKGTVLQLKGALRKSSLNDKSVSSLVSNVEKVALSAASRLCKYLTKQRIFGFDMGLDENGKVWIIEANANPMLTHFKQLKNQTMYKRIIYYKKNAQ
ncbi:hypothetical protein SD70_15385 [Gordoniibacillus kamchatkensis]|uniref:ATP-grasp domain-containing protein n=1 Tax=Gordoniibacillus kamchatkensis TaxID=1590651 RepID=A0ABR5AGP0_9BACL|nr:YheC/YheD family protein [Paenibacillus sp. VKM B-2647]KIL40196.1 hypothetical protein SD70_15385 [Paenibacillus sp. VKM B-2647]